jgi:phosphatidate cytidylyltransferase
MVPRSNPDRRRALGVRILWALILAPPVLGALYFGPPYSDALLLVVGAVAAWEWARLCGRGTLGPPGTIVIGAVVATVMAAILQEYSIAGWLIAVGAMGATVSARRDRQAAALWYGLGVAYLAAACLVFLWLRATPDLGRAMVLWLVAVVWATDTGAYLVGRTLGGAKLAPTISPGKTWAGLFGGVGAAALVGVLVVVLRGQGNTAALVGASMALALVAQVGDLFESSLKRRFGAKDSSHLIPGHGGVLDRVDGLLAGALVLGGAFWLMGSSY